MSNPAPSRPRLPAWATRVLGWLGELAWRVRLLPWLPRRGSLLIVGPGSALAAMRMKRSSRAGRQVFWSDDEIAEIAGVADPAGRIPLERLPEWAEREGKACGLVVFRPGSRVTPVLQRLGRLLTGRRPVVVLPLAEASCCEGGGSRDAAIGRLRGFRYRFREATPLRRDVGGMPSGWVAAEPED